MFLEKKIKQSTKKIAKLQQHLSYVADTNLFLDYCNFINKYNIEHVYFFVFSCFRGRIYYRSIVSPQCGVLFRFIYNLGKIPRLEYNKYTAVLPNFVTEDFLNKLSCIGLVDLNLIGVFYSLGFLKKSKIVADDGKIYFIDILNNGLKIYLNFIDECSSLHTIDEIKENIELGYYVNIIRCVLSKDMDVVKYYIIKDTTASFAQHEGKLLGFRADKLEEVNLKNSSYMYDTYYVYINHLKGLLRCCNNPQINELSTYVDRKIFKGMIMTFEYGVGADTAFENFKNMLDSLPDNYFIEKYGVDDKYVCGLFKRWFRRIFEIYKSNPVDNLLYENTKEDLLNAIVDARIVGVEDIKMHVNYNVLEYNQLEVNIGGKRYTSGNVRVKNVDGLNVVDNGKTKSAAIVNCVHMLDASYLRRIVKYLKNNYNINIVTIHDGFGIQFYSVDLLLYAAIKSFKINENMGLINGINSNINIDHCSPILLF